MLRKSLFGKFVFVGCWFIRVGRAIELLVIKSLNKVGFVVCVVGGDHKLCSGLVGVFQGVWKRKTNRGDR